MKKIITILILTIITGCKNIENNIVTIIEEKQNCIISINYPITNIKKLNKEIKKYITINKTNFKQNYCLNDERKELNIDFEKIEQNNYITIIINTNIEGKIKTKTYTYNTQTKKKTKIFDILTNNDISILAKKINNNKININDLDFSFNEKYLYIYTNNTTIEIPIEIFDLKFKIQKLNNIKTTYKYQPINKTININDKIIAITFDDGPSKYTKKIIDLLNEYDANATFFILGNKVEIYKETLKYLLDNGNEIGNHSYNHKLLTNVGNEELLYQINQTQEIIKNTLNYEPKLFRPTFGALNRNMKEKIPLDIILWNIDTMDWKYKNKNKITNKVMSQIEDGKIILMHDTKEVTYNTLKTLLPKLKQENYKLVTISELKEIKKLRNELNKKK